MLTNSEILESVQEKSSARSVDSEPLGEEMARTRRNPQPPRDGGDPDAHAPAATVREVGNFNEITDSVIAGAHFIRWSS